MRFSSGGQDWYGFRPVRDLSRRRAARAPHRIRAVAAAAAVLALAAPAVPASAAKDDPAARRDEVRRKRAEVASRINVLKASEAEVHRALDALEADVVGQQAEVASARQAADAAARMLNEARAAEDAKRAELAALRSKLKKMAVDAYVNPQSGEMLSTFSAGSVNDVVRKRQLIEFRVDRSSEVADRLEAARQDLEARRRDAEVAQARASERKRQVEQKLSSLQAALDKQQRFVGEVESRVEAALAEADALDQLDRTLSAQVKAREAALAREAAAARARASRSAPAVAPAGGVRRIGGTNLATVRGITVAASIAANLDAMLGAAANDGFVLGGGGYRDPSAQIAVRRANCGTSDYAIYEMPASQCSPPTARPGTSMHERGLAIDFTWQGRVIGSRSSPAFQWLARNAARYGFYNLPSEPWHWSTNGN